MMLPRLAAGKLNRLVEIHTPVETIDSLGTVTLTYVLASRQWAAIQELGVSEIMVEEELQAVNMTDITLRYNSAIVPRARLISGNRTWEVVGVRDLNDAHVTLVATCREIAP
jgi:head-tail adaptor